MLFVAGMWFQDLWTYDFRRTEMCIIPYATQAGEISFCAYNTGVGWRQIVEKMHKNATVAEWYSDARQARRVCEPAQGRPAAGRRPARGAEDSPGRAARGLEAAAQAEAGSGRPASSRWSTPELSAARSVRAEGTDRSKQPKAGAGAPALSYVDRNCI